MAHHTEVLLLLVLATAATTLETEGYRTFGCPFGWMKYEGRCFKYQATLMDWASAEKHCLNLGGHLVSIHSENEYQLVKALIRAFDPYEKLTWIGLNGCVKKFNFFWSDGTKLTFTKWSSGQPDFYNGIECCVHVNAGAEKNWNDIPCNYMYPFVCAKRFY